MDSRGKIRRLITKDPRKVDEIYNKLQEILTINAPLVRLFPGVKETLGKLCKIINSL